MLELARIGGVQAPYAAALVEVASVLRGEPCGDRASTAARLGIAGLDRDGAAGASCGGAA